MVDGLLSRHAPGALAKPFARVQVAVEAREVTRADLEPDPSSAPPTLENRPPT